MSFCCHDSLPDGRPLSEGSLLNNLFFADFVSHNVLRFYISSFAKLIGKEIDYVANARPGEEHYGVGQQGEEEIEEVEEGSSKSEISNRTHVSRTPKKPEDLIAGSRPT